jgi:hypothetical protein
MTACPGSNRVPHMPYRREEHVVCPECGQYVKVEPNPAGVVRIEDHEETP